MDVDLLATSDGKIGLICTESFKYDIAAVMFDVADSMLFIEFKDMEDGLQLNIPVLEEYRPLFEEAYAIEIGILQDGMITQTLQAPLAVVGVEGAGMHDDSYRHAPVGHSVTSLEYFIKHADRGQAVHREDLGNESRAHSMTDEKLLVTPQFSPQLARQRTLEAAPRTPAPVNAPRMAGPGGMGGGGAAPRMPPPRRPREDNKD